MSPMSKKLLKIVLIILAIDLLVAAVPVALQVVQGLTTAPAALPAPFVDSPAAVLPDRVSAGNIAAALPVVTAQVTETGAVVTAQVAETGAVVTAQVVVPTVTASAAAPLAVPNLQPASSSPDALSASFYGRTDTSPNVYVLLPIYRSVALPYQAQPGTPIFMQNFSHASAACSWMSVAGQVLDASGTPLKNLVVTVTGTLDGKPLQLIGLTGMAPDYGPGGFEIQLSAAPVASTAALTIQIMDLNGNPLTEPVPFNTSSSCSENVILINFAP